MDDQDELFKRLDGVIRTLDLMTRLLALSVVKGISRTAQIELLAAAELPPRDIASLLGTTPNAVSVELTRIRAKARTRSSKVRRKPKS